MPFWPAHPTPYHSHAPITLKTKNKTLPFPSFASPLLTPFQANPLLFNGHLQTFWTAVKWTDPHTVYYARQHLRNPADGGHFAVDFVVHETFPPASVSTEAVAGGKLPPRTRDMTEEEVAKLSSDDDTPMVIALHGLSGGSHELYLRSVLAPLTRKVEEGGSGFAACAVNARGCALSKVTTGQLFNARFTEDLRQTVRYLQEAYPKRPLYAVGFSLGANILTNYIGEEGDKCVFKAVALCSSPWNLEITSKALHRTYLGSEVYSKVMGGNLRNLFEIHVDNFVKNPRIDVDLVRRGKYLYEFDRDFTARIFGYATVGAYYRDASSVDNLLKVRVPTFILHAKDDPVAADEGVPYDEVKANPYCFMATTPTGGHLSWFEFGGGRWFARTVVDFFTAFAREVVEVNPVDEVFKK
ncbi:AB-hydrolase YheT [Choiromyces venosus 120613-1]|uniref:AB-hydrolase YheT n=1 Tax=Choiromyces venosus 120613-1 TaxID=1336337 RepID=A0A3N4K5I2_9PEZI|nr:AB-hydrolase YheT [Choiromyces venosus 120613-1]